MKLFNEWELKKYLDKIQNLTQDIISDVVHYRDEHFLIHKKQDKRFESIEKDIKKLNKKLKEIEKKIKDIVK